MSVAPTAPALIASSRERSAGCAGSSPGAPWPREFFTARGWKSSSSMPWRRSLPTRSCRAWPCRRQAFRQPDLLVMYGSSELAKEMPNNAVQFFEEYPTGFRVFPVGNPAPRRCHRAESRGSRRSSARPQSRVFHFARLVFRGANRRRIITKETSPHCRLCTWPLAVN